MTQKKQKTNFKYLMNIIERCIAFLFFIYVLNWIFPYFFFSHKIEYKNYKIYSTSSISKNISNVLNRVDNLISASELYTTNIEHRIFICNNLNLYTFFAPMARKAYGCNYRMFGNIFVANCRIEKDIAFSNRNKNNKRSLSGIIAHEVTHSLINKYMGWIKNKMLPKWKEEGYCEFIAQESSIDNIIGIELFKKGQTDNSKAFKYFEYRTIMDYLINVKKLSFDDVVNQNLNFNKVKIKLKVSLNK